MDGQAEEHVNKSSLEVDSSVSSVPRRFKLPVDSENKATVFNLFSFAAPHMRCFHLSWFSFFTCFVSSFAAPPLLPIIRDNLNLTTTQISNAGIASVSGAVFARLAMGSACDLVGPRLACSTLILLTAPAVFFTAIIDSASSYLLVRFFTGFSLASFVSCQYWMSSMFSPPVVGTANGIAAGWGNLGGGATQLIMPVVYGIIKNIGATNYTAWRIAFFIPGLMQTTSAILLLTLGQDLPDGSFRQLHKGGDKHQDKFSKVVYHAMTNYRAWILALTYGYCFGVELTIDNIIAQYFYDKFNLNLHIAGIVAASFGMANFFSRPVGGFLSDYLSRMWGMRGRLWGFWVVQTVGGLLCILLGKMGELNAAISVMIIFSIFVQAACGLTFGIVPFVSRRSLGLVSGMTGGGGNVGAVLTQLIFFHGSKYQTDTGIFLMGIMIVAVSSVIVLIHFPQWGGMLRGPIPDVTAEDYYMREWDEDERKQNLHDGSSKFAVNTHREGRSWSRRRSGISNSISQYSHSTTVNPVDRTPA